MKKWRNVKIFCKWFYFLAVGIIILNDIQLFTGKEITSSKKFENFDIFMLGMMNMCALWIGLIIPRLLEDIEKQLRNNTKPSYIPDKIWDSIKYLDPDNNQ